MASPGNNQQPVALTIDRVAYESRYFLNGVVHDMFEQDGIGSDVPAMEVLQETQAPEELPPEHIIEIKRAIRDIMDAQEKDDKLQKLIAQIPQGMNEEVVMSVASKLFDDGIFNWGRVIALFFMAYKICKKVVNAVDLFRSLIESVINFMRGNLMEWIQRQGGWEGICDFMRRSFNRNALIFSSVAILAGGIIVYKKFLR